MPARAVLSGRARRAGCRHAFFTTAFAEGACEWECLRGGQRAGGSCVCQPGFWDNSTATGTAGGCEECTRCEEGRQYETSPCVSTVGAGADRACAACTSAKPEHSHYTDFKGPGAGECNFLCDERYWRPPARGPSARSPSPPAAAAHAP